MTRTTGFPTPPQPDNLFRGLVPLSDPFLGMWEAILPCKTPAIWTDARLIMLAGDLGPALPPAMSPQASLTSCSALILAAQPHRRRDLAFTFAHAP